MYTICFVSKLETVQKHSLSSSHEHFQGCHYLQSHCIEPHDYILYCHYIPGIVNRTFENRTQSNSIH